MLRPVRRLCEKLSGVTRDRVTATKGDLPAVGRPYGVPAPSNVKRMDRVSSISQTSLWSRVTGWTATRRPSGEMRIDSGLYASFSDDSDSAPSFFPARSNQTS